MKILNIKNLNPNPIGDILAFCRNRLKNGQGAFLIPMNPIKVIKARSYTDFQQIIDNADWVFPDASGIKYAANILYGKKITLSAGYKVMFSLIDQAERDSSSVYLLGTTDDILRIAKDKLLTNHPELRIVGTHNGFFSEDDEPDIFSEIASLEPDYVFVAMGEYKQEKVIERLRRVYPNAICMGVGGSVDLIAGRQPSPPKWVTKSGIEWLYRAIRQPFRIPRFKALPIFAFLVLKTRFLNPRN
ncbi:MAG: WecB/TagA/CpsF family glycosyltransferase [Planctomycetota bacterium]|jgi:N-acetylglucosaminyldiphosphoundecaprenol N-acetyl-beta-D-mannosaminyltransferase